VEIFKEKVFDLLAAASSSSSSSSSSLRVREHPVSGPYVEGCVVAEVSTAEESLQLLARGVARRQTASTNMNDVSSRSHAVFSLVLTQTKPLLLGRGGGKSREGDNFYTVVSKVMYVCMYVYVCVCMHVCMYVCMYLFMTVNKVSLCR
jgi:hypothetical protein